MHDHAATVRRTLQACTVAYVAFRELAAPGLETSRAVWSTDERAYWQIAGS